MSRLTSRIITILVVTSMLLGLYSYLSGLLVEKPSTSTEMDLRIIRETEVIAIELTRVGIELHLAFAPGQLLTHEHLERYVSLTTNGIPEGLSVPMDFFERAVEVSESLEELLSNVIVDAAGSLGPTALSDIRSPETWVAYPLKDALADALKSSVVKPMFGDEIRRILVGMAWVTTSGWPSQLAAELEMAPLGS